MIKKLSKAALSAAILCALSGSVFAQGSDIPIGTNIKSASPEILDGRLSDDNTSTKWVVDGRWDYDIFSNVLLNIKKDSTHIKFSHSGAQWARPMLFDGIGDSAEGKQYENAWFDAEKNQDRWIELQLDRTEMVNSLLLTSAMRYSTSGQVKNLVLQYKNPAGEWCDAYSVTGNLQKTLTATFDTVKSDCFRFYFPTTEAIRIREMSLSFIKDETADYDVRNNILYGTEASKIKVSGGEIPLKTALSDGKRESADGNGSTKWFVIAPYGTSYIEYDLDYNHSFDTLRVTSGYNNGLQMIDSYYLMYYDGSAWKKLDKSEVVGNSKKISEIHFDKLSASKIRLATNTKNAFRIQEIELFDSQSKRQYDMPANPAYIELETDSTINTLVFEGDGISNVKLYKKADEASDYEAVSIKREVCADGFTSYSFDETKCRYLKTEFGCDNFTLSEIKAYNTADILFKSNPEISDGVYEFTLPTESSFDTVDVYFDTDSVISDADAIISAGTDGVYKAYKALNKSIQKACMHIETGKISAEKLKVYTKGMKVNEIKAYDSGTQRTVQEESIALYKGLFEEYPQEHNIQPELEFTATPDINKFRVVPDTQMKVNVSGTKAVISFPKGLVGNADYEIYYNDTLVAGFTSLPMVEAVKKSLTDKDGYAVSKIVPGGEYTFKAAIKNNGRYKENAKKGRIYFVLTEKESGRIEALKLADFNVQYQSEQEISIPVTATAESNDFSVYIWDNNNLPYTEKICFGNLYAASAKPYAYYGNNKSLYKVKAQNTYLEVKAGNEADFVHIVSDGETTVDIIYEGKISSAQIRPLSKSVAFDKSDKGISFNAMPGNYYSVEINGDTKRPLLVFCDKRQPVPDGDTIIFKGGRSYEIGSMKIAGGQNIYIEENAVVRGKITAQNADGIKICGNGMLIADSFDQCIDISKSDNIHLSGITAMNYGDWGTVFTDSENISVESYKLIGDEMYSDGIDLVNCAKVGIDNVFIKNNDDSICIKLHEGYNHAGSYDITVENSTIWSGKHGNSLEIGYELNGDYVRNVTYKNIDVIHRESSDYTFRRAAIAIHHAGRAAVSDITYEDIRVEETDEELVHIELLDHDDFGKCTGSVSNVNINNLTYLGDSAKSTVRNSSYGGKGLAVTFKGLTIGGKTIGNLTEAKNNGFNVSGTNQVSFIK